jgi:hypothetical protein
VAVKNLVDRSIQVQGQPAGCYDHNFLRFLTIICENIGVFSNTNVMINFLQKLVVVRAKNANISEKIFGENTF